MCVCSILHTRTRARPSRGFTLLELVVVLALVAMMTALVTLGMRPSANSQLHQDGLRLALWLESQRTQARMAHQGVSVQVHALGANVNSPVRSPQATLTWLDPQTLPLVTPTTLWLGPEAILPAQSVRLTRREDPAHTVTIYTDGASPWMVRP